MPQGIEFDLVPRSPRSFPQRRDRTVAWMIRLGWISAIALGVLLIASALIGLGFSLLQPGSVCDGAAASSKALLKTRPHSNRLPTSCSVGAFTRVRRSRAFMNLTTDFRVCFKGDKQGNQKGEHHA